MRTLALASLLVTLAYASARAQDEPAAGEDAADAEGTDAEAADAEAADAEAAAEDATDSEAAGEEEGPDPSEGDGDDEPTFGARARAEPDETRGRSSGHVSADDMAERLARSAPDALRWVPGLTIQQTTHGQASPFIRGLTGQQVLTLFDGIRLNNGLYRQGPNQYFFTVDADSVARLDVVRGSASTLWGSDALAGAIFATPLEPRLDPSRDGVTFGARAIGRFATQDLDLGGRGQVEAQLGPWAAVLVGGGYRAAQALQAAGPITNADGSQTLVPFIEIDGRTQRGTGFRYGTFDARAVVRLTPELRLVGAAYVFRQYDSPRADQCPAPFAPESECLVFAEQFRTLAYLSLRGSAAPIFDHLELTLSYQRQHELRIRNRPLERVRNYFRDDLDTLGFVTRVVTSPIRIERIAELRFRVGADVYLDLVSSEASIELTGVGVIRELSRGQYADGSRYVQAGAYVESELDVPELHLVARGGLRYARVLARAAAEPLSGSTEVRDDFDSVVGRVGATWQPTPELEVVANVDQGFRAPNLDDLTSRQQTGPGFQFENPNLRPESSITYELGARVSSDILRVEGWVYALSIDDGIVRARRQASDCPPGDPGCAASWSQFQLVNAAGTAWIFGGELGATLTTDVGLEASSTLALAWGEGPNPLPDDGGGGYDARIPISRVPPPNGTVEVRYRIAEIDLAFGAAMRWAAAADRLAPSDLGDARIPFGGTPAWAVFDLRASWRFERYLAAHVAFENVFDQPYRVHGSGVNGPGRGLAIRLSAEY